MENPTPSLLDISYMMVFKETQEACGDNLIGVMGYVTSYVRPEIEGGDDWKARFKEMFDMDVPLTTPPSTYDSVMIWAEAVKAVGDATDYAAINDYIRTHAYSGLLGVYDFNNPQQTVQPGPDFPIAYAQYLGDGKLAFYGTDEFIFPPYIEPAWEEK
jgi:ABC-type branched-subunit amino acid transport system substrate-binding protein